MIATKKVEVTCTKEKFVDTNNRTVDFTAFKVQTDTYPVSFKAKETLGSEILEDLIKDGNNVLELEINDENVFEDENGDKHVYTSYQFNVGDLNIPIQLRGKGLAKQVLMNYVLKDNSPQDKKQKGD